MQIIKITPHSFKIILTKDDLMRCEAENTINTDKDYSFLREIIEKTNEMYDCPFTQGSICAEFFESKDGGGELFLFSEGKAEITTYIYKTHSIENLIKLSLALSNVSFPADSKLYCDKNGYILIVTNAFSDTILLNRLLEYGTAFKASKLNIWYTEEHAKVIFEKNALARIPLIFSTTT